MEKEKKVSEKMLKAFKFAKNFISVIEILTIVGVIMIVVALGGLGVFLASSNNEDIIVEEPIEYVEEVSESESESSLIGTILEVVSAVLSFIVLDNTRKIFKESIEAKTPFTEKVCNRIQITLLLIGIISVFGSTSLGDFLVSVGYLYIMEAVSTIFKYGFLLQQEHDETV